MQRELMQEKAAPLDQAGSSASSGASQDIDDFIYLISHDVRASVRALLELPQWIKEDLEDAGINTEGKIGASIDMMNRHTGRLDRMLMDLLAFSRVGRMQTVKPMHLEAALDDVLEELSIPAGFRVSRNLECSEVIMGDRDLPTLLSALVTNAVKHHDKRSGQINVSAKRDGNEVVISVSDDGPGIDEAFHERVFSAMSTLRPRDEIEGSGMGLANARKIADQYGGTANIGTSPFGRGTRVDVRIASPLVL